MPAGTHAALGTAAHSDEERLFLKSLSVSPPPPPPPLTGIHMLCLKYR